MADDLFQLTGSLVAGSFQVERVVAEGGFAVVYKAQHRGFNAPVALKCLKLPGHTTEARQARFREQFQSEAELLFRLSASIPAVVRPLHVDAITAPNGRFMPFLALEWLDGETLQDMARRRHAEGRDMGSLQELVELLTPAAEALRQAHHFHGPDGPLAIAHRDIKPENLFVVRSAGRGSVKILDFGIARAKSVASQAAGQLSTGTTGGVSFTPAFGAPEQWLPKRFGQTGPWTDVFALALTLVEMYVGRPVLDGDQAAMLGAVLDPQRRPTPGNEGRAVPEPVERVFERALAIEPQQRYQDAGSFWDALLEALGTGTTAAGRKHLHEELELAAPGMQLDLASMPPPRPPAPQARPPTAAPGAVAEQPPPLTLPPLSIRPSRPVPWSQLLVPLTAIGAGLLLALLGQQYAARSGQVFSLGPVGLGWITVPMVLAGLFVAARRLLATRRR